MTTSDPFDRGHDVLSYGGDEPARRPPVVVLAVAVACLAVGLAAGFYAGNRTEASPAATPSKTAPAFEPQVAAGAITKFNGPLDNRGFRVSLFNSGHEQITTTVVALPGWAAKLTSTVPTAIAPRSWGVVSFLAPPDCGTYPSDVRVVQIRVRTAAGLTDQIVPLPEPAEALQDYHLAVCGPGWQPG